MLPVRDLIAVLLALVLASPAAASLTNLVGIGGTGGETCTLSGDLCDWTPNFAMVQDFEDTSGSTATNDPDTTCGSSCNLTLINSAAFSTATTCNPSGSSNCRVSGARSLSVPNTNSAAWCDSAACGGEGGIDTRLMPPSTGASWTVGCWVYVTNDESGNYWAIEGTNSGWGSQRGAAQDRFKGRFGYGSSTGFRESDGSNGDSPTGAWHHHVARYEYNGSNHSVTVYLDGVKTGTTSSTGAFNRATLAADDFAIGASVNSGTAATDAQRAYYDLCWVIHANLSDNSICRMCACGPGNEHACTSGGTTISGGRNSSCSNCLNSISELGSQIAPGTQ